MTLGQIYTFLPCSKTLLSTPKSRVAPSPSLPRMRGRVREQPEPIMSEEIFDDTPPPGRLPNDNATPTIERAVNSYPARRRYKPYIQTPPRIEAVGGMIDIHCHAEYGQQDAMAVAKLASANGMYGILYKS